MSRRRMMMLQQSKLDLLEGYRINNPSGYRVTADWLDNNTVELTHTSSGFMGPNQAAINFIGATRSQSTDYSSVLGNTPLNTLEQGKTYKLTLTVTDIIKNTATAENDGVLTVVFGRGGGFTDRYRAIAEINFSELTVGDKLELIKKYESSYYCIAGAAFRVTTSALLWDIKFKVELEEV